MSVEEMIKNDELLTDKEVADYLEISVRSLQRLRKQKRIGFVRITAKKKKTRRSQLEAYIVSRSEAPRAKAA